MTVARLPIGHRVGKLTIIGFVEKIGGAEKRRCRCDCGNELSVREERLRYARTKSCGCLRDDWARSVAAHKPSHGCFVGDARQPPTYVSWRAMRQRCTDPGRPSFKNYGGRGISVCERWENSFENFLADMGERPAGTTLDRIDNDGNYEPDNCRWATRIEQRANRRDVRKSAGTKQLMASVATA